MHWEDSPPRKAINLAAAFGVPDDPTLFRVCILRVPADDPLPAAFAEFLRRVLTEGVACSPDGWEVILFQMNLLAGGFTCVLTSRDLGRDEPPVFKMSSAGLEDECRALPDYEPGDPRAERDYKQLEDRHLDLLRQAARSEPVAGLLRELRSRRGFSIWVCDFYPTKHAELDLG